MHMKQLITNLGMIGILASCTTTADRPDTGNLENKNPDFPALFEAARHADSSHNVQPWTVTAENSSTLLIGIDSNRRLPEVDPENREILLSIGSFIESLVQAAEALGYNVDVEVLADSPDDTEIARITLTKTDRPADRRTLNLMKSVYTEKRGLSTEPVTAADLKDIKAAGRSTAVRYFPAGSTEAAWVREEAPKAALAQAERDPVQRELVDLFHFSRKTPEERPVGMTPEMMGLGGITRFVWYSFFTPETMMKDSNRKTIGKMITEQLENSAGILVITSESNSPGDLIDAGNRYQRMKIAAFDRGIVIHPISQLLEEEGWKESVPGRLKTDSPVQFIARIGYLNGKPMDFEADAVSSPSIRMRPEQFVTIK
jgi:hypothetical protein